MANPFGILFHPKPIETFLWMVAQQESYSELDLCYNHGLWHSFDAHSELSHPDKQTVLDRLKIRQEAAHQFLKEATHIGITLGTAWGYRHREMDTIVANCHKFPATDFEKVLTPIDELTQSIFHTVHLVRQVAPNAQLFFTVSPVRHQKDGMIWNTLSKAHLIASLHTLISENEDLSYFPSYEIMMDELRDYRFYDRDMLHPSSVAVDYIWERFANACLSPTANSILSEIDKLQKSLRHRPFHTNSEAHQEFKQKLEERLSVFQSKHPEVRLNLS